MATKRSNGTWVAPRSGGYTAKVPASRTRSAVTGRFVKPPPPSGRAAVSDGRRTKDTSDG